MAYGWRLVWLGQREKIELSREKMWSRIYLTPLLQAEEDRDQVRRYYADLAREQELLGSQSKPYNSDRYVSPRSLLYHSDICAHGYETKAPREHNGVLTRFWFFTFDTAHGRVLRFANTSQFPTDSFDRHLHPLPSKPNHKHIDFYQGSWQREPSRKQEQKVCESALRHEIELTQWSWAKSESYALLCGAIDAFVHRLWIRNEPKKRESTTAYSS